MATATKKKQPAKAHKAPVAKKQLPRYTACTVCEIEVQDIKLHNVMAGHSKPDTLEQPKVPENAQPGEVIGDGLKKMKVPYTYGYIKAKAEREGQMVTFIPNETKSITYQGVTVQLYADVEITVPAVFKGLFDNYRKELVQSSPWRQQGDIAGVQVLKNAGPIIKVATEQGA